MQSQLSAHWIRKPSRKPSCEATVPGEPLCKLSLQAAASAINLGQLASPVQEGEMHELFIERKSSQAQREGTSHA